MSRQTAFARSDRTNLYAEITDRIVAELESGRVPWAQPWETEVAKAPLGIPKNATTDRHYSGINVLILWGAVIANGYPGQSRLTFGQALSLSANIRTGEHGTTVVYPDPTNRHDALRAMRDEASIISRSRGIADSE